MPMPDLFPDRAPEQARTQAPAAPAAPALDPALTQNPPDRLGQVLGALYDANESVAGSILSAGLSLVPGVDQVLDAGDLALNVWRVSTPEHRRDPEAWTNLALTGLGAAIPVVGDALEAGLKAVMRGGPRAASALAETVAPLLRARGIDPVAFFERQARAVPGTLDRAVAGATEALGTFLDRAGQSRFGVPDWVERAAREAAGEMRAAGAAARRGVQGVADEIAGAFRSLAAAAGGGRRAAGNAAGNAAGGARRSTQAATGGPQPQHQGSGPRVPGALARQVESVSSVADLRKLAREGSTRPNRRIEEGNPNVVFERLSRGGTPIPQNSPDRFATRLPDGTTINIHPGSGANLRAGEVNHWSVGVIPPGGREEKFRFEQWPTLNAPRPF